ncbi:MAG: hypothetical protein ACP5I1_19630 [Candidatus Hinthialibacter sp.]
MKKTWYVIGILLLVSVTVYGYMTFTPASYSKTVSAVSDASSGECPYSSQKAAKTGCSLTTACDQTASAKNGSQTKQVAAAADCECPASKCECSDSKQCAAAKCCSKSCEKSECCETKQACASDAKCCSEQKCAMTAKAESCSSQCNKPVEGQTALADANEA